MRGAEAFGAGYLEVGCLEAGFPKLGSGYRMKRLMLGVRHQRRLLGQDVLYVGRVGETIGHDSVSVFFLPCMSEPNQKEKVDSPHRLRLHPAEYRSHVEALGRDR